MDLWVTPQTLHQPFRSFHMVYWSFHLVSIKTTCMLDVYLNRNKNKSTIKREA